MSVQPNRDFGRLAEYLGIDLEQARRICAQNDEICSLQSAASGEDLHPTVSVNVQLNGQDEVSVFRYPRRPGARAMDEAESLAEKIAKLIDSRGDDTKRILSAWSRNVVPGSASMLFPFDSSEDGQQLSDSKARARIVCFSRR